MTGILQPIIRPVLQPAFGGVGRRTGGGAPPVGPTAYQSAVLADSPIAWFRLRDTAPVGSNSIVDAIGTYAGTPVGGITWGLTGSLSEGGTAPELNGTTGYITGGATLANTLMGAAAWTIEVWFFVLGNGDIFAAKGAVNSVRIQYFNGQIFTSSSAGGSKSKSIASGWHHLTLNSVGALIIDGVAASATSGASTNSTNQLTIGALNNGTAFLPGRVSEVAIYTSALSLARSQAHFNAGIARTAPTARTFYHDFEQMLPVLIPPGSDFTGQLELGATLSSAQAYAGAQSLSLGGATFRAMTFDNFTNQPVWAGLTEGRIRFRFRISSGGGGPSMLMQLTGKDRSGLNDFNYGIAAILSAGVPAFRLVSVAGTESVVHSGGVPALDTWHECTLRWRSTASSPNISITVNGVETTGTSVNIGNFGGLTSWHHLLWGNDTATTPTGYWIDEAEVFGNWV